MRMVDGKLYCDEQDYGRWLNATRYQACVPHGIQVSQFAPYSMRRNTPHPPRMTTTTLRAMKEKHQLANLEP